MKFKDLIICFLLTLPIIAGCGKDKADSISVKDHKEYKIGVVLGLGGLGDKAFNDMQYNGIVIAKKQFNVDVEFLEPKIDSDVPLMMKELREKGCNVIFFSPIVFPDPVIGEEIKENPQVKYVILDDPASSSEMPENLASVSFSQNEGSFLAGALSAMESKRGGLAAIGGQDLEVIRDFMVGFEAGARYINPEIKVIIKFIPESGESVSCWDNPAAAKSISDDLYQKRGVNVIFGIASASNLGIFQSAKDNGKYAIGVDTDQDYIEPGVILTSMMKRLDYAIVFMTREVIEGRFENRRYKLGLKDGGVSLSSMKYTKGDIASENIRKLEKIRRDIVDGKIKVPTVY